MKAVVLNSGGFDSIVMINYLYTILGETNLHSLHFLYGAKNEQQQLRCVEKVCDKLAIPNKVIKLPAIDWTSGNFFDKDNKGDYDNYLEYRNLIFLSYAISYAESIGAEKVYIALLNQQNFPDTTIEFLRGINSFTESLSDITVDAPFIFDNKYRLGHIAKYLGIGESDYFSCDYPNFLNEPCGKCPDCIALQNIQNKILKPIDL